MNSTLEIEKQILALLKKSNKTLPESILSLAHIIHCSALALNLDPAVVFDNLQTISRAGFKPQEVLQLALN